MFKLKLLLVWAFLIMGKFSFSQTASTINKLDDAYQNCLDQGVDMVGCSTHYYKQMDSMLNIVYKKVREKNDSSGRAALKSSQLKWLSDRDKHFKQIDNEPSDGIGGEDKEMIAVDKKTQYVRVRVLELIKELEAINGNSK